METNQKWLWSGKMIDCNGRVSRFHLGEKGKDGSSPFLLELLERDGHASQFKGEVNTNESDDKKLVFHFEARGEKQGSEPLKWTANLKPAKADRYAKTAAFGTYEVADSNTFLSNGVIILWQFA